MRLFPGFLLKFYFCWKYKKAKERKSERLGFRVYAVQREKDSARVKVKRRYRWLYEVENQTQILERALHDSWVSLIAGSRQSLISFDRLLAK